MRKFLQFVAVAMFCAHLWAQGSRYDSAVLTSANNIPYGGQATVYTVPFAYIKVCAYPTAGNPCTNAVNVYSDPGLTQAITQPFQADVHGRFGFWVSNGSYAFNAQSAGGTNYGNFPFTVAGTGGGSATFPSTPGLVYSLSTSSARNGVVTDVTGLFTGCSGTLFLRADGTCGGSGLSLTTTGTSGPSSLTGTALNIPDYTYTLTTGKVTALGTLTNDISGSAAKIGGVAVSGVPGVGQVPVALSSTTASWQNPFALTTTGSGAATYSSGTLNIPTNSAVYPAAGIPNSTGTAWGTSYSTSGAGLVALTTSPVFTTPTLGVATATSVGLGTAGGFTWNGDTGIWRLTPGQIALGNGTPGDESAVVNLAQIDLTPSSRTTPIVSACGGGALNPSATSNSFYVSGISSATSCTVTFGTAQLPIGVCVANANDGAGTPETISPDGANNSAAVTFHFPSGTANIYAHCF